MWWLLGLGLAVACGEPDMRSGQPPPTAASQAGSGAGVCPALPLAQLCEPGSAEARQSLGPLRICPNDAKLLLSSLCSDARSKDSPLLVLSRAPNDCDGGSTLRAQAVAYGEADYFYDKEGELIGARTRDYRASAGCGLSQDYGKVCKPLGDVVNGCGVAPADAATVTNRP